MSDKLSALISWIRGLSTTGKVIAVVIITLLSVLVCVSCSTSRNISLTVDKAESVNFSVQDSSAASLPFPL